MLLGKVVRVDEIEVVPRAGGADSVLSLLGAQAPSIDAEQVRTLRGLPGVAQVLPKLRLRFPAQGWGGRALLNEDIVVGELLVDGIDTRVIDAELAEAGIARGTFRDPYPRSSRRRCTSDADCGSGEESCALPSPPTRTRRNAPHPNPLAASGERGAGDGGAAVGECLRDVPAVVSTQLVELFNGSLAPAHGWPRVGDWILRRARGLTFTMELGRSYLGRSDRAPPRQVRARIVGVSRNAAPLGLTLPLETVRRWNGVWAEPFDGYTSVLVRVRSASDVSAVVSEAKALGLDVPSRTAEQVGIASTGLVAVLGLVALAIVAVAASNIAQTFLAIVTERRRELAVLRALGASARAVALLVVVEACVVGTLGSLAGLGLARLAAWGVDLASARWLPPFPYKPDTYFAMDVPLVLGAIAFGTAVCALAALAPAVRAARSDPAALLAAER
ncbi:MAG: FtsX-like permease family protein [Deltaproteobacteria bacterium]|nr:FtsX-like permease family protein [Deltaproteobacteria bacterium]